MHPIEHLRYVARATGADPALVAREAAYALAEVAAEEPAGLVPGCRRLIEHHLTAGPLWWLAARLLGSPDPAQAARAAAAELDEDGTERELRGALPDDATVLVLGWPDLAGGALRRRADLEVLVVDAGGEGASLARRLVDGGAVVSLVPEAGVAAGAVAAGLILVEALAAGPGGVMAVPGSHAASAVAAHAGIPVWAVTGVGRVLPDRLWEALLARVDATGEEPWERPAELVPAGLLSAVVGPAGLVPVVDGLAATTCPVAPELLRNAG